MTKRKQRLPWWCFVLVLVFIRECVAAKRIPRIQRRFMWKQMDDTMDGIIDSMASSARAMRSMIGEIIPGMTTASTPLVMHSNVFDYLPSETTKVKYVVRNPSTKPMKIIKMSAPKKVIKIMTIPKPIIEGKHSKPKFQFPSAEALRQLEREQEMIAEGRAPPKSFDNGDIIGGKINEFGGDWRPVTTEKPYPMSELHTKVVAEPLPEPEKQIYERENELGGAYDESKHRHNYEVTEHTPEETVAVPYAQHYQNSRGFVPIRSPHSQHSSSQPHQHHHQQHQHHQHQHQSIARVGSTASTTTTVAPNYPMALLKKPRDRPVLSVKSSKPPTVVENATSIAISKPKPLQYPKLQGKTENWPILGPTAIPSTLELSTVPKVRKAEPISKPTTDERLKPKPTKKGTVSKPRDIRQRGTVKFGDKLTELYE